MDALPQHSDALLMPRGGCAPVERAGSPDPTAPPAPRAALAVDAPAACSDISDHQLLAVTDTASLTADQLDRRHHLLRHRCAPPRGQPAAASQRGKSGCGVRAAGPASLCQAAPRSVADCITEHILHLPACFPCSLPDEARGEGVLVHFEAASVAEAVKLIKKMSQRDLQVGAAGRRLLAARSCPTLLGFAGRAFGSWPAGGDD